MSLLGNGGLAPRQAALYSIPMFMYTGVLPAEARRGCWIFIDSGESLRKEPCLSRLEEQAASALNGCALSPAPSSPIPILDISYH